MFEKKQIFFISQVLNKAINICLKLLSLNKNKNLYYLFYSLFISVFTTIDFTGILIIYRFYFVH